MGCPSRRSASRAGRALSANAAETPRAISGTLIDGLRRAVWVLRGVLGEHAYDDYLAHHRSTHTDDAAPPMTAREFWRDRTDSQDRNPEGRCC